MATRPQKKVQSAARKAWPWLRRSLYLVVGLYLTYVIVLNLAFVTGGYEKLVNGSQDTVQVHFESAWTAWPFVVHLEELHIVVDDSAVQLEILAEEASVDFSLGSLTKRIVDMDDLRGQGFVFRLRRRKPPGELDQAYLDAVPPLPDIEMGPVKVPDPFPDEDLSNNWNVRMRGIDAHFSEIWINANRYRGSCQVSGGFYLRTEDMLRLWPSKIAFDEGRVAIAGRDLVTGIDGWAKTELKKVDLKGVPAEEVLSRLSIGADLTSSVVHADALEYYLPKSVVIEEGHGKLRLAGSLSGGKLKEGTFVDVDLKGVRAGSGPLRLEGPIDLYAVSRGERVEGRLEIGGHVRLGPDVPPLTLSVALLHGQARAADLREPFELIEASLDLKGGAPRFGIGGTEGPRLRGERLALSVQASLNEEGELTSAQAVSLEAADLRWGSAALDGIDATARVYTRGGVRDGRVVVDSASGHLSLKGKAEDDGFEARVEIGTAYGSRRLGRVDLTATMSTLEPVASLPPLEKKIPDVAAALLDLEDASASLRAQWDPEVLTLVLDALEVDSGTLKGWVELPGGPPEGVLLVNLAVINVGVAMSDGKSNITMLPDDAWERKYLEPGLDVSAPKRPAGGS